MGKKSSKLSIIYLIGMALVVIGFICPMFKMSVSAFGKTLASSTANGFHFIDFDKFNFVDVGALLIFIGACLGLIFCFVPVSSADMIKLICLIVSIAGGIVLVIGFTQDDMYKFIGKQFFKHAYIGFYMILVGWVVGLVGWITKK